MLAYYISQSEIVEYLVRTRPLLILSYLVLWYLSPYFARIYNGDTRSVRILALMPMIYYVFDYVVIVYTDLWIENNRVVAEFLPLMLVLVYMTVTILYSNELQDKMSAEYKAGIVRITSEQQKKEMNMR